MPCTDHFIAANGLRLHYCAWGPDDAPTVLLLHGGSAHAHWWDYLADSLGDAFRLIALDLRGHGESAHAKPPAYRVADYAKDVAACVDRLGLRRFHLVGHSLGAMVAGAFAIEQSTPLISLVLVDAQLRFSAAGVRYLRRLASFPQLFYPDLGNAVRRFRVLPTQTNAVPAVLAHVATCAFRKAEDGRWVLKFDRATLSQLEPQDLVDDLAKIEVPLLLVRGEHSTVLTHERIDLLRQRLPSAEVAEIPGAHHHVMLDNPAAFAAALRSFLDRHSCDNSHP